MMSIQIVRPGEMRAVEAPEPVPPPGWARVRVRAAAVCMTDFEVLRGAIAAAYPVIPGHEWSGVVESVADVKDEVWIGRRVTGDNEVTCRSCRYCRRGEWRRCPEYRQIGFAAPGAYAEKLLVPVPNLYHLPDSVSFEQGALLEPLGIGLAVARMAHVRLGSTVVVLGTGPIGLNCLVATLASGARRVLCLDQRPARLALACEWGAFRTSRDLEELDGLVREFHPQGTDVVIDATGQPAVFQAGARLARFAGVLVLAGYFGGREATLCPDMLHERNLRVLGAGNNCGFTEAAMLVVGDGLLRTEGMISHHLRLDQYEEAFSGVLIASPGFIKGVFLFP